MELALSTLRVHRSNADVCHCASALLHNLCCDEAFAIKAKQLGAPALLQAALKAHKSDVDVQKNAADALARIQHFIDAAFARAEANMAELVAGEEAAKRGKGTAAAPKKAGKGKGKTAGEGAAAGPRPAPPLHPPPPLAAGDISTPTKAQIKRRKAKAAAAARKAAAAPGTTAGEEEEEEVVSDASSDDSEPFRPRRPPLDFSADGEFRRSMHLPPRLGIEAEIDKMVAESEARHAAKLAAAAAMHPAVPQATHDAACATVGATASVAAAVPPLFIRCSPPRSCAGKQPVSRCGGGGGGGGGGFDGACSG